jgi:hypothetical protein
MAGLLVLKNIIKNLLFNNRHSNCVSEKQLMLSAQLLACEFRKREKINKLADVEFSVFSQWGEDGIIDWIVDKIPNIPQTFVEFGVENYQESNTRFLLQHRNWKGMVIDGSNDNITNIRQQNISWRHDLSSVCAFIDRDNINELIQSSGFSGDIGLLSIDIDGNDYWVWEAIECVSPAIVVCEYNAVLGDKQKLSIPYQANFERNKAHHSNLYFGASLPALTSLAKTKGYSLIGTNSNGVNAFFIRDDKSSQLLQTLEEIAIFPSVFRESRDIEGKLTFSSSESRLNLINQLDVYDLDEQRIRTLDSYDDLYSVAWRMKW